MPTYRYTRVNRKRPCRICGKLEDGLEDPKAVPSDSLSRARFFMREGPLMPLFLHLHREYVHTDDLSPLVIESVAYQMLAEISRQAGISDRRPSLWLVRAREIVDEHFAQQLTLESIADFVSVHPVHLARKFRRHFKQTVGEYMRLRRVEYACRQLEVGTTTIAEIAIAAGFADQSHLTRTFKRLIGTTPAEYRKAVKG